MMLMFRISLLLSLLFCLGLSSSAQINQVDEQGRKQGVWRKNHPNGKLRYEGTFLNDQPTGIFRHYSKEGLLQSENHFYAGGRRSFAVLYGPDKKKAAEGVFQDQKKDSVWLYYRDTMLLSREIYKNGKANGVWKTWYDNGTLAEEMTYVNGVQEGPYRHYYDNGQIKINTIYKDGMIEGKYEQFYPSGKKLVEGVYSKSLRRGEWNSYLENGKVEFFEEYNEAGTRITQKRMHGTDIIYYDNNIVKSEIPYVSGKKNGDFKEYYELGEWKVRDVRDPATGEVRQEQYFEGQKLKIKGFYFNDQYHGTITWYNPDGSIQKSEKYQYGKKVE